MKQRNHEDFCKNYFVCRIAHNYRFQEKYDIPNIYTEVSCS